MSLKHQIPTETSPLVAEKRRFEYTASPVEEEQKKTVVRPRRFSMPERTQWPPLPPHPRQLFIDTGNQDTASAAWSVRGFWPAPRLMRKGGMNDYRYEKEREMMASELYFDLIYVIAFSRLGMELTSPSLNVVDFLASFFVLWTFWTEGAKYATRFGSKDIPNLLFYAIYMSCVVGLTVNLSIETSLNQFLTFALIGMLALVVVHARIMWSPPSDLSYQLAKMTVVQVLLFSVPLFLALVEFKLLSSASIRTGLFVIFIGLYLAQFVMLLFLPCISRHLPISHSMPEWYDRDWCGGWLKWFHIPQLPLHLEHFTERTNLFVVVLLGYLLQGIAIAEHRDCATFYGSLLLSFFLVTCLKMLYFEADVDDLTCHALRRHRLSGIAWSLSNVVLMLGFLSTGAGLQSMVKMHGDSCTFTDTNAIASRLILVGIGVTLLALSIRNAVHVREWDLLERRGKALFDDHEHTVEEKSLQTVAKIRITQIAAHLLAMTIFFSFALVQPIYAEFPASSVLILSLVILLSLVVISFVDEYFAQLGQPAQSNFIRTHGNIRSPQSPGSPRTPYAFL